ncbi:MAG: tripartite tricarboxylate transporter TctB family protein [Xanthobacteraceae bacterium]
MIVRADHVAGAAFVVFGVAIFALSGDLPMGGLSMPGSGFLPTLVASLLVLFGIVLCLRAAESAPLADLDWSDVRHAVLVILITALAIVAYTRLGFILTMGVMLFAFLVIGERRDLMRAAAYSVAATLIAYGVFAKGLNAPLPIGPFGF